MLSHQTLHKPFAIVKAISNTSCSGYVRLSRSKIKGSCESKIGKDCRATSQLNNSETINAVILLTTRDRCELAFMQDCSLAFTIIISFRFSEAMAPVNRSVEIAKPWQKSCPLKWQHTLVWHLKTCYKAIGRTQTILEGVRQAKGVHLVVIS